MSKIVAVYNSCDPLRPLEAGDPRYVPCERARGMEDVVAIFARRIARSDAPLTQLFAGHLGGGKSTEVLRLKRLLEKGPPDGGRYLVIYFEADKEDVDINEVQVPDLILAVVRHVAEGLLKSGIELRPGRFGGVLAYIADKVGIELGGELNIFGLAKLTAKVKNSPESRKRVREALEPRLDSLVQEANEVLAEAGTMVRDRGYRDLVVIVDNLDRIPFRIVHEPTGRTNHELLFLERAAQLQALRCHVIYDVPISLTLGPRAPELMSRYANVGPRLPMVKIREPKGKRFEPGWDAMRQMLEARLQHAGSTIREMFSEERLADRLIEVSGGHPRHLLTLFRFALDGVADLPVTREAGERAIQNFVNSFIVDEEDWPLLPAVHRSKRIRNDLRHQGLLHNLAVLEYLNTKEPWYDVHPALQRRERFREELKRAKAKKKGPKG